MADPVDDSAPPSERLQAMISELCSVAAHVVVTERASLENEAAAATAGAVAAQQKAAASLLRPQTAKSPHLPRKRLPKRNPGQKARDA